MQPSVLVRNLQVVQIYVTTSYLRVTVSFKPQRRRGTIEIDQKCIYVRTLTVGNKSCKKKPHENISYLRVVVVVYLKGYRERISSKIDS